MEDKYDRNRVTDITDPTVRMINVVTMTDSRAMRRKVSSILASHTVSLWVSCQNCLTVSDCAVIS